jgi:hypothetical protein
MRIQVDCPAAWFLLPLDDRVVRDPDEEDDQPRYSQPPRGGWGQVGETILRLYERIQSRIDDPLIPSLKLEAEGRLTHEQEWITSTWFSTVCAPQLGVDDDSWINGQHRSWGLRSAGFEFAPVLLVPFGDAIHFWEPDPLGWPPLDVEAVRAQRGYLARWQQSPWSMSNPQLEQRWSTVLERWETRIAEKA